MAIFAYALDESVIGRCMEKYRHEQWFRFLRLIDRNTPKDNELH